MLNISGTHLPTLLPIYKSVNKTSVVAKVWVDTLETALDLTKVFAYSRERLGNISREDTRGSQKFCGLTTFLRGVTTTESRRSIIKDIYTQIISTLPAEVGHGVNARYTGHEATLLLVVLWHMLQNLALAMVSF
jgi:hypothetical protein